MQMQAIKQNGGKQCNASDMQGKMKVGTENGANASDVQKKIRRASKMVQMQAVCKENEC